MKTELNFNHIEIPQQDLAKLNGGSLIIPGSRFTNLIIAILAFLDPVGII